MTWQEIVRTARDVADSYRADASVAWFRGHRDVSFKLSSTLHRYLERLTHGLKDPPVEAAYIDLLRKEYKTLYRNFMADAWPLLDERTRSDWGIVFTMQHYGLPTRLLDWTESFACAVFFAQQGRAPSDDATIWVLNPEALNKLSINQEGFVALADDMSDANVNSRDWHPKYVAPEEPLRSVAGAPIFTNARMTAQRSAFTIGGDSQLPLDEEFPDLVSAGQLRRIDLPASTFDDACEFLQLAGLNAFSFYPDLQGLALRHEAETNRRIADFRRFYPDAFHT